MRRARRPNNFEALWGAIGHPEWATDPRFAIARRRDENWATMMWLLDEWASTKTAAECEARLIEGGTLMTLHSPGG